MKAAPMQRIEPRRDIGLDYAVAVAFVILPQRRGGAAVRWTLFCRLQIHPKLPMRKTSERPVPRFSIQIARAVMADRITTFAGGEGSGMGTSSPSPGGGG